MYNIKIEEILPEGTILNGRYIIDAHLASGGFGNTYVATDYKTKEKVAIKEFYIREICVRRELDGNVTTGITGNRDIFDAQQKKFHTEAQRIRTLDNEHIVRVRDLFSENGTSYYVMDFIKGHNLYNLLKVLDRPLSETETMHMVEQLLDALEYIHGKGIFHLDLKPANAIVQEGSGLVKLIDFGSSKMMENGRTNATRTGLNYSKGYAPLEQMEQNIEKVGPWTDLYALGATMYNLLTRQQPPMPSDISENGKEVLQLPSDISETTRFLVHWLMCPDRKKRPQSVKQVKDFLNSKKLEETKTELADSEEDKKIVQKPVSRNSRPGKGKPKKKKKKSNLVSNIIKAIFILLVSISIFCIVYRIMNYSKASEPEETTIESEDAKVDRKYVTDSVVHVKLGPDFMHEYTYTGEVSLKNDNLPQGYGTAVAHLKDGRTITYKGRFKNGLCEDNTDNATMKFSNGAKYEGTFVMGYYKKGTFTDCQGNVFVGEFFNKNQFKNGKRTMKDGTVEYYNNGKLKDTKK